MVQQFLISSRFFERQEIHGGWIPDSLRNAFSWLWSFLFLSGGSLLKDETIVNFLKDQAFPLGYLDTFISLSLSNNLQTCDRKVKSPWQSRFLWCIFSWFLWWISSGRCILWALTDSANGGPFLNYCPPILWWIFINNRIPVSWYRYSLITFQSW